MRIIAGMLGGRNFSAPKGNHTRPMSDKVRGALFNTLGDIEGLSILDAFSGSGAIGFEALSRGALSVVAIESDKAAQVAITRNVDELGLSGKVKLIRASISAWMSTTDDVFDIVISDPPYDNVQPKLLGKLAERAKPGGVVVLSLPPKAEISLSDDLELLSHKAYGDAELYFYRKTI